MNRTTLAAIATVAAITFGIAGPAAAQVPARDHQRTTVATHTHRMPYLFRVGERYIF